MSTRNRPVIYRAEVRTAVGASIYEVQAFDFVGHPGLVFLDFHLVSTSEQPLSTPSHFGRFTFAEELLILERATYSASGQRSQDAALICRALEEAYPSPKDCRTTVLAHSSLF